MNQHKTYDITASMVLYKERTDDLVQSVQSFLAYHGKKKLLLIDHSPTKLLDDIIDHPDVDYIFMGKNLGFGAGHNVSLTHFKNQADFHLVLNPDIRFTPDVIPALLAVLAQNDTLALIAPKVTFPNGMPQPTCRRYPSLGTFLLRRMPIVRNIAKQSIQKGEYSDVDLTQSFAPDFLHGCFLLFRTKIFEQLKGFDERYFLYMEDVDICKKIDGLKYEKLYYPNVSIEHALRKGSDKNLRLFLIHIHSAFKYFFKWGFSTKKR